MKCFSNTPSISLGQRFWQSLRQAASRTGSSGQGGGPVNESWSPKSWVAKDHCRFIELDRGIWLELNLVGQNAPVDPFSKNAILREKILPELLKIPDLEKSLQLNILASGLLEAQLTATEKKLADLEAQTQERESSLAEREQRVAFMESIMQEKMVGARCWHDPSDTGPYWLIQETRHEGIKKWMCVNEAGEYHTLPDGTLRVLSDEDIHLIRSEEPTEKLEVGGKREPWFLTAPPWLIGALIPLVGAALWGGLCCLRIYALRHGW
jgi:hypothetical protein